MLKQFTSLMAPVPKISTLWRFLLPVALMAMLAPFALNYYQSGQRLANIESEARTQAQALIRLLHASETLVKEQVFSAMRLLKQRGNALGSPALEGHVSFADLELPGLTLGNLPQTGHFDLVDQVTEIVGGTATLFVKSDDRFVRIATTIRRSNGERAIGTVLDPNGAAIHAIREGRPYYGIADILGEPYITGYEPMRDIHKNIVGIWYVGYKIDMQVIREAVERSRFLDSGFVAIVDTNNQPEFLSDHLPREKASAILKAPGSDWVVLTEDIPGWDLQVKIAYPLSEAHTAGLSNSLPLVAGGVTIGLGLILIILWQLRRLVIKPLGGDPATAIELVKRISSGDLADDGQQAPRNTLMANILGMRRRLREMLATLHENADRLSLAASVFDHAHDGIFITDAQGSIVEINPSFSRITGHDRDQAIGQQPRQLGFACETETPAHPLWKQTGESWSGEIVNRHHDGATYTAWLDIFSVRSDEGEISHYVGLFSDITKLKQHQDHLEHMAYHDALTQLPNRTLFSDRLQQALGRAERTEEILAVCYFDLDGFKPVNDTLGHEAGDQLLIELAHRLRNNLRAGDTAARLGGDEFAMLLCNLRSEDECRQTVNRLLEIIAAPYFIQDQPVGVSASMGITLSPFLDDAPDTLLRHADQAMYQAKLAGKNRFHFFDSRQDQETRARNEALKAIHKALDLDQFCLYYQPKVDMRFGKVIGTEALIRWNHPTEGILSPAQFLPLVEHTDFAIRMGEWVIETAFSQVGHWLAAGLNLPVSVNIAARHLMHPEFAARLQQILQRYPDTAPALLELEITESAALEDIASVTAVIETCHAYGVKFALDDFGAGYSSLTYLRRLPADLLKIDQSFVRDMLQDPNDMTIVASVISLSRDFNRQVIAEGVETAEHGERLLSMDCYLGQGYGIAPPMPAGLLPDWVAGYRPPESWTTAALTPIRM